MRLTILAAVALMAACAVGEDVSPIPVTVEKDLAGIGKTQVFHYPGYGKARVSVSPVPGEEPKRVSARIGGKTFALAMDGNRISALVDVPAEPGRHPLDIAAELADGSRTNCGAVAALETRRWEWQGHSLGKDRIVLPRRRAFAGDEGRPLLQRQLHPAGP